MFQQNHIELYGCFVVGSLCLYEEIKKKPSSSRSTIQSIWKMILS